MRILVIGGGGREHALVWKLRRSPSVEKIYCAPGNGGISLDAECVDLDVEESLSVIDFVSSNRIDLTVVGPEAPLVAGLVDVLSARGLRVFGPRKEAAMLEGSKSFAKGIMERHGIPTGAAKTFDSCDAAKAHLEKIGPPVVVKADGLAAGKGVFVAMTESDVDEALDECFVARRFGDAGSKVIFEEYLVGQEVSLLSFTDGHAVLPMMAAQDYKRIFDGDEGPNTGGMGCYSPVPIVSDELAASIVRTVHEPTVAGLAEEGIEFMGVLYGGIILTEAGPKVLEFNVRFGDPETQVILPRMKGDLCELMLAVIERNLTDYQLEWTDDVCITVVVASGGYPGSCETGKEITGLEAAAEVEGVTVFHAGTVREDGRLYTSGGRVLNVTALAPTFREARERAYEAISRIHFDGMQYRTDIAKRVEE